MLGPLILFKFHVSRSAEVSCYESPAGENIPSATIFKRDDIDTT